MIDILDASASRPPAPRIQTRRAAFPLRKLALATNIKAAIFFIPIWCRTKQLKLRLGGPGFGSPATTCRRPEDDHRAALTNPTHQPSACDDFKGGSGTTSHAIKSWSASISMTTHPAIHGLMAGLIAGMSGSGRPDNFKIIHRLRQPDRMLRANSSLANLYKSCSHADWIPNGTVFHPSPLPLSAYFLEEMKFLLQPSLLASAV